VDRTLNVLILGINYAPEPTGIAPYTTGLARFLSEAGHSVQVVTSYPHYPSWEISEGYTGLRTSEIIDGIPVTRIRHPIPKNPAGISRIFAEAVFGLHSTSVRVTAPDVVVATSPALLTVAAALTRRRKHRTAVGVIVQDLYSRAVTETGLLGGRSARAVAALELALLSRVDGISVIHDSFQASLTAMGIDPDRIEVVRNWSHISLDSSDPDGVRDRLNWSAGEIIALHAGNMGLKQGLDNIVEAARCADQIDAPVRFVLLGDGSQRSRLERLGRGIRSLQFLDPVPADHFPSILAASDVLLLNELPGVADMCVPSKLTSYFAAGRPTLAATGPSGAAAFELAAAQAGYRVDPGDPLTLLEAVLALARDGEASAEAGRRGQRYVQNVLSERSARSSYIKWIEQLATSRRL